MIAAVFAAALAAAPVVPRATDLPAGAYVNDPAHTSLVVRLDHLGFSTYVARFTDVRAALRFDPAEPESAELSVTIDPVSIAADNPPAGFLDDLRAPDWLDAAAHPAITFVATRVELTAPNAAKAAGELTLLGVARPVVLDVTFNGGWAGIPPDPHARAGFSATAAFNRSDFGLSFGLPPDGSTMGVGDRVEVTIEVEMIGPNWTPPTDAAD